MIGLKWYVLIDVLARIPVSVSINLLLSAAPERGIPVRTDMLFLGITLNSDRHNRPHADAQVLFANRASHILDRSPTFTYLMFVVL